MLPEAKDCSVWLETTSLEHGHGGSDSWAFGQALWSPSRSRNGRDIYALMRRVKRGDLVLHLLKGAGGQLTGFSRVQGPHQEIKDQPPSPGDWAGMAPYYRVPVEGFTSIEPPLSIRAVLRDHQPEFREVLKKGHLRLFYGPYKGELRLNQGGST